MLLIGMSHQHRSLLFQDFTSFTPKTYQLKMIG